ncbi:MAG: hypothetical protein AB1938_01305 [Myxococcota bacterium]
MRKTEMTPEQLRERARFVELFAAKGWKPLPNFTGHFDDGLWIEPEAAFEYDNGKLTLRCDRYFADPRVILYLDSREGKTLGLVFKCPDTGPLLAAIVGMQDDIGSDNLKEKADELFEACPRMFKISGSGDRLIPVKSKARLKNRGGKP